MKFTRTELDGAIVVELEPRRDERGWFARSFSTTDFREAGFELTVTQANVSYNAHHGTLRGMHWQTEPHGEAKLVRCTSGATFDVVVDVRSGSATFGRWASAELTPTNGRMMLVGAGLAHGFLTLADGTEVSYLMSGAHTPDAARGARYDDPAFGIEWPAPVRVISERDRAWPLLGTRP